MIMTEQEINAMSSLALAHMGDAVYELFVRRELCKQGRLTNGRLHHETVGYVAATAQAKAAAALLPKLTEQETAVYKRARNTRSHAAPKGASEGEYHAATALEALFGWLYLRGEQDRLEELFALILEARNNAD